MKISFVMAITYYIGGSAVAAWMTVHGLLDMRLTLFVLPLMSLAHVCGRAFYDKLRIGATEGKCLCCEKNMPLYRRLANHRFCSKQHEQTYLAGLEELAIARLRDACPMTDVQVKTFEINLRNQLNDDPCEALVRLPIGAAA